MKSMIKRLFVFVLIMTFTVNANFGQTQVVLLDDGFENYTDFVIDNFEINNSPIWTGLDLDQLNTVTSIGGDVDNGWYPTWNNAGAKMAFQVFNFSASNASNYSTTDAVNDYNNGNTVQDVRNFDPHGGNKYAGCWNAEIQATGDTNQDWLIAPAVTLGVSGNTLTFWIKELSNSYGDEQYKVGVYTGSGSPASSNDFTIISGASNLSPTTSWVQKTYSLDSYAGQTIKIGIYCETPADLGSMLMVDDVKIAGNFNATSLKDNNLSNLKVYPNPTSGEVNITSGKNIRSIKIYNAVGQEIRTLQEKDDISDLDRGVYILKINFDDDTVKTINVLKN